MSQPLGRWLHLLLRHKGPQHLNDLEDRPSAARHQMARTSSHSQGCSTHVATWLRRELKTAAFVAAMKGSMQNNSRSINAPFCSTSRWSVQWQICSICSSAASDCQGRLHGHIFQTQFCNFIFILFVFFIFFATFGMVSFLRCAMTGIFSDCNTPGKWHGQITNVSRLPQQKRCVANGQKKCIWGKLSLWKEGITTERKETQSNRDQTWVPFLV